MDSYPFRILFYYSSEAIISTRCIFLSQKRLVVHWFMSTYIGTGTKNQIMILYRKYSEYIL